VDIHDVSCAQCKSVLSTYSYALAIYLTTPASYSTHASPKSLSLICPFGSNRKFCGSRMSV
jgi:hypothetical protein